MSGASLPTQQLKFGDRVRCVLIPDEWGKSSDPTECVERHLDSMS